MKRCNVLFYLRALTQPQAASCLAVWNDFKYLDDSFDRPPCTMYDMPSCFTHRKHTWRLLGRDALTNAFKEESIGAVVDRPRRKVLAMIQCSGLK